MELTFQMDTDSQTPLYHQLYHFIKTEIQSGKIGMNTKLPSKRKLSSHLKISQNTIQAAYDQLIQEGYVTPCERRGFFVNKIENLTSLDVNTDSLYVRKTEEAPVQYDFSYNGVDIEAFPYAVFRKLYRDTIDEGDKELLVLGESQGHYDLRDAITCYLHQSRGVNCSAGQIILSSGTEFLLHILIQLLGPGSIYGIENPGYEKLNQLFAGNHANFVPVDIDGSGMIPEKIIQSNANILCVTPAHQFPSGEIMSISRRVQILNWAKEAEDRYIIEDDYDSEFKYSGKPVPALQGLEPNEKVIYMGAFSKSLSPAIRVSYMVLPDALLRRYIKRLSYIICPVPGIEQKVMARFITNGYFERHLNKMRTIYKKKRQLLMDSIKSMNCNIKIIGADAGLHLLVQVDNGMSEDQLVKSAERAGVKVYGISNYFTAAQSEREPTILLGYASMKEDEILKAVCILERAWAL